MQISCNPHQKRNFSGPGSEPKEQRITRIPRNSFWVKYNHANSAQLHHFSCLLLGKKCIEQGRKSREFRVIHFGSSSITRILRSSHQIVCFLCTQLRTETGEVNLPDLRIRMYLKVCIAETGDKVIRTESVSVAINRKWY